MPPPTRFARSVALALASLATCVFASFDDGVADAKRPLNLLFVLSDQHRSDALSCAGHPFVRTPHLDRLAREGVRFASTYVQAPICIASRASMFTCTYPGRHGIWANERADDLELVTWPEVLRERGYETVAVGKLHTVDGGMRVVHTLVGESFPRELSDYGGGDGAPIRGVSEVPPEEFFDARIADAAIAQMRALAEGDAPWALFVGIHAPHPPLYPPRPYDEMYAGRIPDVPDATPTELARLTGFQREQSAARFGGYEPRERARMIESYYGLVTFADEQIGRILEVLDELELADRTVVVHTSDHGDHLGEHALFGKFVSFYDGEVRVPGILRAPGLPAGLVVDEPIETLDLVRTALLALGVEPPASFDGHDLRPLIAGDAASAPQYVYSTLHLRQGYRGVMVRMGSWKLCWYSGDGFRLYDLEADPREENDLAADPRMRDRVRVLRRCLIQRLVHTFPDDEPQVALWDGDPSATFSVASIENGKRVAILVRRGERVRATDDGRFAISAPEGEDAELEELLLRHLALTRTPRNPRE